MRDSTFNETLVPSDQEVSSYEEFNDSIDKIIKEKMNKKELLIEYIRDNKKNPIGVVVVSKESDTSHKIGWSLCYKKDHFNKRIGRNIAFIRVSKENSNLREQIDVGFKESMDVTIPRVVERHIENVFINRCKKYFKVDSFDIYR